MIACVTYNSAGIVEDMLAALPSALRGIPTSRVIVTDNGSEDGTPQLIRKRAPWVTLVEAGGNVGYAAGINLALRSEPGRRGVYVLNPDAIPSPDSVAELLQATEADPSVGISVPAVLAVDGQLKFSLRREPTILRALGEAILGGHRAARFPRLGDMIRDPTHYRDGASADWATGAAMFVSRSVIDAIGDWDERFFLYSEETDFALRARDAGFRLQLVTKAQVMHPGGAMSRSPYLWSLVAVNRTRLFRKRHGLAQSLLFWVVVLLNESIRGIVGRRSRIRNHRAAVRALLDVGPNPPSGAPTPSLMRRIDADAHARRSH